MNLEKKTKASSLERMRPGSLKISVLHKHMAIVKQKRKKKNKKKKYFLYNEKQKNLWEKYKSSY